MIAAYVPDVGDGLAAGIRTLARCDIQIDCGSQQYREAAFEKGLHRIDPDVFFLSHFHVDHYNGLFEWRPFRPFSHPTIEHAYFPRVPEFRQRETFIEYMLVMNHRLMGDTTGSMEADFLGILSQINSRSFTYRALSSGDRVHVGGTELEILWPPKVIDDELTLKVIKKAISDFEAAMEQDEILHRMYEWISESGQMRPYIGGGEQHGELRGRGDKPHETDLFPREVRDLPDVVRQANESLRGAANHLSLAFHEDNRFLFMGDLEGHEIEQVVGELLRKQRDRFLVLITPHHGTHWQRDLGRLRTWCAISSVGDRLFGHVCPQFKSIAEECLFTHLSGDIEVPMLVPWWHGSRPLRYWRTFL